MQFRDSVRLALVILCVPLAGCLQLINGGDDWAPAVCGDGQYEWGEGETCDDGNRVDGDGCSYGCQVEARIDATWTIQSYDGTPAGCPAGYEAVVLKAVPEHGDPQAKAFLCADGQGTMPVAVDYLGAPSIYMTTLSLVSADRMSTFSVARVVRRYLTYPPSQLDFKIYTDAGYFTVGWEGCWSGNGLTITATSITSTFEMSWNQSCEYSWGTMTEVLPLGDYKVTLTDGTRHGTTFLSLRSLTDVFETGSVKLN